MDICMQGWSQTFHFEKERGEHFWNPFSLFYYFHSFSSICLILNVVLWVVGLPTGKVLAIPLVVWRFQRRLWTGKFLGQKTTKYSRDPKQKQNNRYTTTTEKISMSRGNNNYIRVSFSVIYDANWVTDWWMSMHRYTEKSFCVVNVSNG